MKSLESRSCYNFPQQRKWVRPISELLCQLSVWLLRILFKVLVVKEHFLGKGRKPRMKSSRVVEYFDALNFDSVFWFWKSRAGVVLETTKQLFILNVASAPSQSSSLKYRPLYMTAAWLSRGAWWNQRHFHKIHAHHTGVGLCTCILALTPEGTELCLLQDWNK